MPSLARHRCHMIKTSRQKDQYRLVRDLQVDTDHERMMQIHPTQLAAFKLDSVMQCKQVPT